MKIDKHTATKWADGLTDPSRDGDFTMVRLPVAWIDARWKLGGVGYFEPDSFEYDAAYGDIRVAPIIRLFSGPPTWVRFLDGRHRFSVLRDSGATEIWVAIAGHSAMLIPEECEHVIWRDNDGMRAYGKQRVVGAMREHIVDMGEDIHDEYKRKIPRDKRTK